MNFIESFNYGLNSKKFYHNENAFDDLDINESIFNAINKTITIYGQKKLKNKLYYCSSNVEFLESIANGVV
jgi:hypothetical protein